MTQQQLTDHLPTMADPDHISRARGALDEIEDGEMSIEPTDSGTFEVKGKYEVDPRVPTCDCKDFEFRVDFCKHIVAVRLQLLWGNVEPISESEPASPPKPDVLDPVYDNVPRVLRGMDHWVAWKQKLHENKDGSKRWTKVPVDVQTGGFASSTDSDTWVSYDEAAAYVRRSDTDACGIGFVVGDDDAVVGIDIDDCRDPDSGEIDESVEALLDGVESYAEVSPSGTGLRIFTLGEVPEDTGNEADLPGEAHIEMYWTGRYLTVTGLHVGGTSDDLTWDEDTLAEFTERCNGGETDLSEFGE